MVLVAGVCFAFSFFYSRRTDNLLDTENHKEINELPPYRSLFEPSEEELRALEREEKLKLEAKKEADARQVLEEKTQKVKAFRQIWQNETNKRNTVEILRLASLSESAETFSESAEDVVNAWRNKKLTGLNAEDLADLLDSHLRILTQQERTSGKLFWLKQEIMSLRHTKSEEL